METNNTNATYNVTIVNCSKELSKIERIAIKDTGDATPIDQILDSVPDNFFVINVNYFAELQVHNEKAKGDTEYSVFIIIDNDGNKFCTSSRSFYDSFMSIADEMEDEPFSIKVFRKPSKNFSGKYFISCSINIG